MNDQPFDQARLNAVAAHLRSATELYRQISVNYDWVPADTSDARLDEVALPTPDPRLLESDESGFWLISDALHAYMAMAASTVNSLATLYEAGDVALAPQPIDRSLVEACARVISLLPDWEKGDRLADTRSDRLARAYLEHLASANYAQSALGAFGLQENEAQRYDRVKRLEQIIVDIKNVFPDSQDGKLRNLKSPRIGRVARKDIEESVQDMHAYFKRHAGGSISKNKAHGVYALLTAAAHPTLYAIRDATRWVDDGGGKLVPAVLPSNSSFDIDLARYASLTFYLAVTGVVSYFGWPSGRVDLMTEGLEKTFPGVFN